MDHQKEDSAADEMQHYAFIKSSYCQDGGCVEVAQCANGDVMVRDGKNPGQPALAFDKAEWTAFLKGVKNDEFGTEGQA